MSLQKKNIQNPSKEMRTKARKAYDNAKYRCTHDLKYAGVNFNFKTHSEFIKSAGWPKSADVSLDRIDPNGHYEAGNVRWVSTSIQNLNKKHSHYGSKPSISQLVEDAKDFRDSKSDRLLATQMWHSAFKRYLECRFKDFSSHSEFAAAAKKLFALNSFSDLSHLEMPRKRPDVFHMPSLTVPVGAARISGGPSRPVERLDSKDFCQRTGYLPYMKDHPLARNMLPSETADLLSDLKDTEMHGAVWVGSPTQQALLGGWFEGKMLAACARMHRLGLSATVLPALSALEIANDYDEYDPFEAAPSITRKVLFIPDFQVDYDAGWRSEPSELFRLSKLVAKRAKDKKKTFIGVQNLHTLPRDVQRTLLHILTVREFDPAAQPMHPSREAIEQEFGPDPTGQPITWSPTYN